MDMDRRMLYTPVFHIDTKFGLTANLLMLWKLQNNAGRFGENLLKGIKKIAHNQIQRIAKIDIAFLTPSPRSAVPERYRYVFNR